MRKRERVLGGGEGKTKLRAKESVKMYCVFEN